MKTWNVCNTNNILWNNVKLCTVNRRQTTKETSTGDRRLGCCCCCLGVCLLTVRTLDLAQAFQSLGIMLNDKEILTFFNYIDTDNSGDCSMQEMLAGCLPKHFTSKPWWEKSRERQNIIDNIKKEHERAMHRENRCTHPTLTTSALMKEIRVKVEQTASKGSDQIRLLFFSFSLRT